ncbi:sugar phosphate isomerase/epimerase family protein [Halorarum salinum]|uniref:Sugar phosphate isomerase/epimerase n=1 Tax=Halorarum salinum TaxID=2743089 RepID=A0A7D5QDS4_9EURY|nr:sugar phosphate isomerase/epimerase [Halobaculum salinum]QLG64338.1 sugar phosphate isomerase/epimerase [Halobaculum salinum]
MRFGFSSNAFREHALAEAIDAVADAGYDGIEILLDDPHLYPAEADEAAVEHVLGLLDERGLAVSNCNAFMLSAVEPGERSRDAEYGRETEAFHHPSFVEPDAADRRTRVEHTEAALETAAALGAPHVSVPPGGPVPVGTSDEEATDQFVEGLRTVAERAEAVGVDVLVEPEPDLLVESSAEFLDLMERVDSPRVGCNFDAGHFFCVGEDPAELVETLEPHTRHYHLEDIPADRTHEHTQLGEGGMDIEGFLTAVEDSGYDGFVTVELYPYGDTAPETAREAMAYLRERGWA